MTLKGKGRFVNRPTATGGRKYDKFFLYIPTDIVKDSQFIFKEGDEVEIMVDTKRRIIVASRASK